MPARAESTAPDSIDISIILEWENVLLSESERCFRMLRQLSRQIVELSRSTEVLVLFNPQQVDQEIIEEAVATNLDLSRLGASGSSVRIEKAEGQHYYELKNEGAARANGQVVVFIDSDVIPEDGWLYEISRAFFERSDIQVVAGNTYLAYDSLVEKAFALGWFFPLRESDNILSSDSHHLFANSVAFRRETFLQFRFPTMHAGINRGACVALANSLEASGVSVWSNTGARASHPPPSGLGHYLSRGLSQGRDRVLGPVTRSGQSRSKALRQGLSWSRKQIRIAASRISRERHKVDLPLWQAPVAFGLIFCYYSIAAGGSCLAVVAPRYSAAHWQI